MSGRGLLLLTGAIALLALSQTYFMLATFAFLTGWRRLARAHPDRHERVAPPLAPVGHVSLHAWGWSAPPLRLGYDRHGIVMRPLLAFRPLFPTIVVPWNAVAEVRQGRSIYGDVLVVHFGHEGRETIAFHASGLDTPARALTGGWKSPARARRSRENLPAQRNVSGSYITTNRTESTRRMSAYQAPLRDLMFDLKEIADIEAISKLPGYESAAEFAEAILEQAGDFASEVLDPLNKTGDREGAHFDNGRVTTPAGFKNAFQQFAKAGWIGLPMPEEYGGQGLPMSLSTAVLEMWQASNMAFSNGPLLNQGAIEAILLVGTDAQKKTFIPKLVSGEWTGTMDLTEPQAGSDLAQVRTKAVPQGDHYLISGQKIFITYGEHDYTENIVHLVLARTPSAPEGVKGISLFVVPKMKLDANGNVTSEANDVVCAGIEHKMGIHASPTCTMNYGEKGGAIGYLIGEENQGLKYMFIMMNAARFSVGVQGYSIADRAFQAALDYARDRVQSKDIAAKEWTPVRIIDHPDVRRMLMNQKSQIEAMRALAFFTAAQLDHAHANPDAAAKAEAQNLVELFTPLVKAWSTEVSTMLCSDAMQVFGGVGFTEEYPAAQYYRDVRICQIYEGTTGIQSNDLMGRKFLKDNGKTALKTIGMIQATIAACEASSNEDVKAIGARLADAVKSLSAASQWIGGEGMKALGGKGDVKGLFAGAVPYLMLWGYTAGGWMLAKSALVAEKNLSDSYLAAKVATARFYAEHVLPKTGPLAYEVTSGGPSTLALTDDQFDVDRKALAAV